MSGHDLPKDQLNGLAISSSVGQRLQMVRQHHGLSQRELARRAEITNSTLSMIEQGKVSPSIASLEKILNAIPFSLQAFFSELAEKYPVVFTEKSFIKIRKKNTDCHVMPLLEGGDGQVYMCRQIIEPAVTVTPEWMIREGFLGGFLVSGELTLVLDGREYPLLSGEGFHFSLQRSHMFVNPSTTERAIVVASCFAR